jgi:hypothetical protein
MGRDRQCKSILVEYPLPRLVKTVRFMGRSDEWPREEPDDDEDEPKDDDDNNEEDDENDEDDGYSERGRSSASRVVLVCCFQRNHPIYRNGYGRFVWIVRTTCSKGCHPLNFF